MATTFLIGKLIHQHGSWLSDDLVSLADEALTAHEEGRYPLTIVRVGACLEGLLQRILSDWEVPLPGGPKTLGPLIKAIRESGRAPEALLERLNEANAIRNRAPHHKPSPLSEVTTGDSLQILHILSLVVQWYGQTVRPGEGAETTSAFLPVFLSIGSRHRLDQEQFNKQLRSEMRRLGVQLHTLEGRPYSTDRPFEEICALLKSCRAALIVGLERSHAYTLFEREKSDAQKIHQDLYIPTAWNQIEGGMSSALGLPVLVLREHRLLREGIFEASSHGHQIRDFDLALECRGLSAELRDHLAKWVDFLRNSLAAGRPEGLAAAPRA
jgi:hypothetical protein